MYEKMDSDIRSRYFQVGGVRTLFDPASAEWKWSEVGEKRVLLKEILKSVSVNDLLLELQRVFDDKGYRTPVCESAVTALLMMMVEDRPQNQCFLEQWRKDRERAKEDAKESLAACLLAHEKLLQAALHEPSCQRSGMHLFTPLTSDTCRLCGGHFPRASRGGK